MADTVVLNAEPSRPADREDAKLPPKSFADAVEQGPAVDETVDAKSGSTPQSQNEKNGTQVGLKEENILKDEPITTEGIANGNVKDAGDENVQKVEVGDKSNTTTPEINGSDNEKMSYAEAVRQLARSSTNFVKD